MNGEPIQLVAAREDRTFELINKERLCEILLADDVRERRVVVVSVAGAFRKGKSFLLNFFLRYLHHEYNSENTNDDWLGSEGDSLQGFGWEGGPNRRTVGIQMWSHVFKIDRNGEKLAVILLDTQGIFDSKTTMMECIGMFAMSTMLASVQVYNLSQNIQENDLQHLQLFTEYGRLALRESPHTKPFQHLWFLVRDWAYSSFGYPYGTDGGEKTLRSIMSPDTAHDEDMRVMRTQMNSCFEQISCFVMPHPGLVVNSSEFDGKLEDLDAEFKEHLRQFVPMVLAPSKLVTKKILGAPVTAFSLFDLFNTYIQVFNRKEGLPDASSVFRTTAIANNENAVKSALHFYMTEMKQFVEGEMLSFQRIYKMAVQATKGEPYQFFERILNKHPDFKEAALKKFDDQPKMGGAEFASPYRMYLIDEIDKFFQKIIAVSDGTNLYDRFKRILRMLMELLVSVFTISFPRILPEF